MPHRPPENPKIYHILHVDRLASVITSGRLFPDAVMAHREDAGTVIGMSDIKERRRSLPLKSHPGLYVGDCVPFYFCPRSVMLFIYFCNNHPNLAYRGGQSPIIHLEADLRTVVQKADEHRIRWAFTLSNAGAMYFEDRCNLEQLTEINWEAVKARDWGRSDIKEAKQAEFLIEKSFPWPFVERIGVYSPQMQTTVQDILKHSTQKPVVEVKTEWYY
jgi:hypothetical protein